MRKVRMFCDWDNSSRDLIERLKQQTVGFEGDVYYDIEFVDDDSYDFAVIFNHPKHNLKVPPDQAVCLILEPPEIYHPQTFSDYKVYCFVDDGINDTALGLGFATAPIGQYTKLEDRPHRMMMICSDKLFTKYHHIRRSVLEALLKTDLDIHFYGRNIDGSDPRIKGTIAPFGKHMVLPQYQYCIDFENFPNAITDKYYDPIICGTIPITNSWATHALASNSVELVDFDWSIDKIIEEIQRIKEEGDPTNMQIVRAQHEITQGNMCLAKWIREHTNGAF